MNTDMITTDIFDLFEQKKPFLFLALVLSITLIACYARNSFKSSNTKRPPLPPGPPGWPIIGNLAGMIKNRPNHEWIHRVMAELKTEIACFRFVSTHVITITSDEIAREALKDKDEVLADRQESYSAELIGDGYKDVGFANYGGELWKKLKRVMTSELMSLKSLNKSVHERTVEADNLLAYVHNLHKRSEVVNVREIATTFCHSVKMRLLFGRRHFKEATEDGGLGPMEKDHVDAIFKALDCFFNFSISDYVPWLRGWNVDGDDKAVRDATDVLTKCNDLVIDERVELWRKKGGKEVVEDWLDVLITSKNSDGKPMFTPQAIKAQCKDIKVAALDNPINNVEWTFAEMLNNPEILKKAVGELDEVVGRDRLVQESDISNLNYLKACSRESFRLHPAFPFLVPHVAREDTTLAGYFIPKGSIVLVSRVGLGRNPKIWEEPDAFRPERHLNNGPVEVSLAEQDMRFVSFSTGRRGCVGYRLGTSMTVMLLARLLQGFDWSLPPGTDRVEFNQAGRNLLMATPLMARVQPRLAPDMYPGLRN
ncbi:PREDICTED: dihomomethionine N-hydroxylase-like [Tarenaya hassleriana]|uniref:dihomomethionine N-hydroxylase-like n=1 Tax=Tarenaya hassleriana TaxID=28532 RepID=UPI00053C704C|nr:PREDICTED: dihomomethionine N-hydroxylase-like [Tarenaya hassleriana]